MRRRVSKRKWDELTEDDPSAGLLNLFDVWIAFAVAVLLAMLSYSKVSGVRAENPDNSIQAQTDGSNASKVDRIKLDKYKPTTSKLSGEGERLGTAYRLKTGEVVYVPDQPQR